MLKPGYIRDILLLHCLRVKEAVQVDAETIDTMDLSM